MASRLSPSTSHNLMVLSIEADTIYLPLLLNAVEFIQASCPLRVLIALRLSFSTSQNLMVPSPEAETIYFPSLLNVALTKSLDVLLVLITFPFSTSQNLMVLSPEAETIYFPSLLNATEYTLSLCPLKVIALYSVASRNAYSTSAGIGIFSFSNLSYTAKAIFAAV